MDFLGAHPEPFSEELRSQLSTAGVDKDHRIHGLRYVSRKNGLLVRRAETSGAQLCPEEGGTDLTLVLRGRAERNSGTWGYGSVIDHLDQLNKGVSGFMGVSLTTPESDTCSLLQVVGFIGIIWF